MDIGICDDDQEVCLSLARRIRAVVPDALIRIFESAEELLQLDALPAILFLDVMLRGMDGLTAARALRKRAKDIVIIFISGNPEYVFDAFDVDAANYLVKPFDEEKLRNALRHAQARRQVTLEKEPQLLISKRGSHMRVRHRDIRYAEVLNRTITLHTTRGDVSYYGKMAELEKQVGEDFIRSHRAYLVNFRYVDSFDHNSCRIGEERIPIAKSAHAEFVRGYMRFIRGNEP